MNINPDIKKDTIITIKETETNRIQYKSIYDTISKEDIKRIKENKNKIRRGWILPYPLTLEVIRYEDMIKEQRKNKWYYKILKRIGVCK